MISVLFYWAGDSYRADMQTVHDISLPLWPGGANPNCYYAEPPAAETIRTESFVGSVRAGGSCNYQRLCLTPHGNGTHTEGYGHLSPAPTDTVNGLTHYAGAAWLATPSLTAASNGDQYVGLEALRAALPVAPPPAVIVRTRPNPPAKRTRQYSGTNPPYLAPAVGTWLAEQGVQHLLVDLPSVDRESDKGALRVHRGFWNYPEQPRTATTITELIYVPDEIPDGLYLLLLTLPNIALDAVPSRPLLFPVTSI